MVAAFCRKLAPEARGVRKVTDVWRPHHAAQFRGRGRVRTRCSLKLVPVPCVASLQGATLAHARAHTHTRTTYYFHALLAL